MSSAVAHGSNVVNVIPDQRKTVRALSSLDLLVTIDPFINETTKLSHYVLPTKMGYERPDLTMFFYESLYNEPYARYTPAISALPNPRPCTVRIRSTRFSGFEGSGWWFGKSPSTRLYRSITSQPSAFTFCAKALVFS